MMEDEFDELADELASDLDGAWLNWLDGGDAVDWANGIDHREETTPEAG